MVFWAESFLRHLFLSKHLKPANLSQNQCLVGMGETVTINNLGSLPSQGNSDHQD